MKLAADIQKIERDKRLKRRQEIRELPIPLHQKRNMRKERLTTHPKSVVASKQSWPKERKGEDVLDRSTEMPKVPTESTQIRPDVVSGGASLDLVLVEETLLVEVGYRALHIKVPKVEVNENGSVHAIVPVSP